VFRCLLVCGCLCVCVSFTFVSFVFLCMYVYIYTLLTKSCHTYIWMIHVTHMNESCHTRECVKSHIWMSHVTHVNESCHTYDGVSSLFVCEFTWCNMPRSDMCMCIQVCVGVHRCVYVYTGIAVWVGATLTHISLLLRIYVFSTHINIYYDSVCSNIWIWKTCVCVHKCRYVYTDPYFSQADTYFSQVSLCVHRHIFVYTHSYFSECVWGGGALTYICGLWRIYVFHIHRPIDWCCFCYFVRNSLVALLEALCAQCIIYTHIYVLILCAIYVCWIYVRLCIQVPL